MCTYSYFETAAQGLANAIGNLSAASTIDEISRGIMAGAMWR